MKYTLPDDTNYSQEIFTPKDYRLTIPNHNHTQGHLGIPLIDDWDCGPSHMPRFQICKHYDEYVGDNNANSRERQPYGRVRVRMMIVSPANWD